MRLNQKEYENGNEDWFESMANQYFLMLFDEYVRSADTTLPLPIISEYDKEEQEAIRFAAKMVKRERIKRLIRALAKFFKGEENWQINSKTDSKTKWKTNWKINWNRNKDEQENHGNQSNQSDQDN